MTLTGARVSDSAGRLVIAMNARGDLRGLVTLTLSVGPDGTITSGDWALVVSHLEDLNPDGTVAVVNEEEPHEHSEEPSDGPLEEHHDESSGGEHHEFIRFVNKGTLGGDITGGFVGTGADGALALVNVQLQLTGATLTFASTSSGTGSIDADLGSRSAQGSLRLTF
jgi:hypothetical protein